MEEDETEEMWHGEVSITNYPDCRIARWSDHGKELVVVAVGGILVQWQEE